MNCNALFILVVVGLMAMAYGQDVPEDVDSRHFGRPSRYRPGGYRPGGYGPGNYYNQGYGYPGYHGGYNFGGGYPSYNYNNGYGYGGYYGGFGFRNADGVEGGVQGSQPEEALVA